MAGWVGSRTGLDVLELSPMSFQQIELRFLGHPAIAWAPYWLIRYLYFGSCIAVSGFDGGDSLQTLLLVGLTVKTVFKYCFSLDWRWRQFSDIAFGSIDVEDSLQISLLIRLAIKTVFKYCFSLDWSWRQFSNIAFGSIDCEDSLQMLLLIRLAAKTVFKCCFWLDWRWRQSPNVAVD